MVTNRRRRQSANAAARERAAALRAAQVRADRRRLSFRVGAGVAAAAAVGGGITAVVLSGGHHTPAASPAIAIAAAAAAGTGQPPWPRPGDTTQRAASAGLRVAASEGTVAHFHAHLDVLVNGRPITVPAGLGNGTAGLAELHTHDTSESCTSKLPRRARHTRWVSCSPNGTSGLPGVSWAACPPLAAMH